MKKTSILLIAYFVWISQTRVDAYLDPGSGSMLVQLLLGGVAGRGGDREARLGAIPGRVPLLEQPRSTTRNLNE